MRELEKAFQLFQQGQPGRASEICHEVIRADPSAYKAQQLLGLIAYQSQQFPEAEKALIAALSTAPEDPECLSLMGRVLTDTGRRQQGAGYFKKALSFDPGQLNAAILLGNYLLETNDPTTALDVYERAIVRHPDHPTLMRGMLFALKDCQRNSDAEAVLTKLGPQPDLQLATGQLKVQQRQFRDAEQAFERAIQHPPTMAMGLRNLLQLAYMSGGEDKLLETYSKLTDQFGGTGVIYLIGADVLKEVGQFDLALDALSTFEANFSEHPEVDQVRAAVLIEKGKGPAAFVTAEKALSGAPGHPQIMMRYAQSALMAGHLEQALEAAQAGRAANPNNSFWTAIEGTALKGLGRAEAFQEIMDFDLMVQSYDIECPEGYPSVDAFLSDLKTELLKLHEWKSQPLAQSLRGGTQTTSDLRFSQIPVIKQFFETVSKSVEAYISNLPSRPDHPFYGRKSNAFRFAGAWSVNLETGGFHVNHIHPDGWISSAFYVDVPDDIENREDKAGWIQFGNPPFPVDGVGVEKVISPKAGRLVLFPSYMWHGTLPTVSPENRLTLPFDILPD